MKRSALLLLVTALALAGCSIGGDDGGSASIEVGELKNLVLQPGDVPRVFVRFDEGRQGLAEAPGGSRGQQDRFDRLEGWKARYRRAGTRQTKGPLVISSLVDVFESTGGAGDDFEALRTDLLEGDLKWQPVDAPHLGDEAVAMTLTEGSGQTEVTYFVIAWREDNVVASLDANGFGGKITLDDVVSLARKQAQRTSEAVAS